MRGDSMEKTKIKTYNDGVVQFVEVVAEKLDEFGSPILGREQVRTKDTRWFRHLGITSDEQYAARAIKTEILIRIAVRWKLDCRSGELVRIGGEMYAISRVFQNSKEKETELSLSAKEGGRLEESD